jgi:outer membrane biosynthesis protein TonB
MPSRNILMGALLCVLALGSAGCRKRSVHAAPPAIVSVPPAEPEPEPKPAAPPETKPATTPAPPSAISVPPAKPAPAKPRPAPPEPMQPKPAPPQLSPRLTPEQQAEAERRTNDDIALAEKNLVLAAGRTLNSAQQDLVEKIRGFIGQAREAIRASDWVRARNLAQKAQVLSNELVNSL